VQQDDKYLDKQFDPSDGTDIELLTLLIIFLSLGDKE
jgi:hypothetical protein